MNQKFLDLWLKTRPKIVQEMAAKYPPNSIITAKDEDLYILGWTEGGDLICSTTSPSVDYEKAMETKIYICSCCLEQIDNLKHLH
jgi:hypothetical protein